MPHFRNVLTGPPGSRQISPGVWDATSAARSLGETRVRGGCLALSHVCWCGARRVGVEAEWGKERRKTRGKRKRRDRETAIKDPQKSSFLCLVCLLTPSLPSFSFSWDQWTALWKEPETTAQEAGRGAGGPPGCPGQATLFYFFETVSRWVTPGRSMSLWWKCFSQEDSWTKAVTHPCLSFPSVRW